MDNYIEQALRTKSDKFYGERVSLVDFRLAIGEAIAALSALDKIKKTLFYGKGDKHVYSPSVNHVVLSLGGEHQRSVDILHSILGKATESGESLEALAIVCDGGTFDAVNFCEEIGDGQWYDAIGLAAVSDHKDFSGIQATNIAKLRARFPDKFTEDKANVRDLDTERTVLESDREINDLYSGEQSR